VNKITKIISALLLFSSFNASAVTIIYDEFNSSTLDSQWSNNGLTNYSTGAGLLSVYGVSDPVQDGNWGYATLSQSFDALGAFNFTTNIGGSSGISDMQSVSFNLIDAGGSSVASVGFTDAWIGSTGSLFSSIGGSLVSTGADSLPAGFDHLTLGITRDADNNISFSSGALSLMQTGVLDTEITGLEINFGYFNYPGSTFGTEHVYHAFLEGEPSSVPEPSSFFLMGLGMIGLFVARRKKTVSSRMKCNVIRGC